ncbi:TPA: glycoside hydrolase family 127 protein [Candidatus Poribacteria bacterium]|nr:glycoside hydrolase family 127 protein [Candidatus Poribacteria bacterium]
MTSSTKRKLTPVPLTQVTVEDVFWAPRIRVNRERTIPHEYKQCKDTGRIDAFLLNWKPGMEPKPHYFWDSDVAKWIEAASYSLATHPEAELDALLDEVIEKIAGAQQENGYLNNYFTQVEPENRWINLGMWHELYCAGHLMEAAVAHFEATGKRKFLDVMCRYADYIDSVFGPGKRDGCPGHEEIELALVKLYRVTGEQRYLKLSQFFLDQRGQKPSFFKREMEKLTPEQASGHRHFFGEEDDFHTEYCQDHLPVREQSEVVGHAVRAMYLYCGMADVANETGDQGLLAACERLWDNVCRKRMYITGGIGPSRSNEGFTQDYDLPNESAYAETCAAVALVFWNHRLLQLQGDSRFADVMERALYNGTISGVSLDGKKFFYVNPLESRGDHHRQDWFGCACCPPNIARLIASIGGYIYSQAEGDAYVHLYVRGSGTLQVGGKQVVLRQETDYPWDGTIRISVEPKEPTVFGLNLRIPNWSRNATLIVNGEKMEVDSLTNLGYARIEREWKSGDEVELVLPMPVERIESHPAVRQNSGCVALQRGPVVYCIEQVDNPVPLHRVILPHDAELKTQFDKELLGGVAVVKGNALIVDDADWDGMLYRAEPSKLKPFEITAIPYYAWDHREPGEMRVWIREM